MKTATAIIAVALITLAILAATGTAHAQLLHNDNFTRDTESGLDWLDLRDTAGYSVQQIQNERGGFLAAGWRFATAAEIQTFFESATGLVGIDTGNGTAFTAGTSSPSDETKDAFIALIECVQATEDINIPGGAPGEFSDSGVGHTQLSRGFYLDDVDDGLVGVATLHESAFPLVINGPPEFVQVAWNIANFIWQINETRYNWGTWMVRDSVGKINNPKKHRC